MAWKPLFNDFKSKTIINSLSDLNLLSLVTIVNDVGSVKHIPFYKFDDFVISSSVNLVVGSKKDKEDSEFGITCIRNIIDHSTEKLNNIFSTNCNNNIINKLTEDIFLFVRFMYLDYYILNLVHDGEFDHKSDLLKKDIKNFLLKYKDPKKAFRLTLEKYSLLDCPINDYYLSVDRK